MPVRYPLKRAHLSLSLSLSPLSHRLLDKLRKPKRPQRERTGNQSDSKVLVFGTRGSAEAFAIRDFLYRCDVPFQWIEGSPAQPDALPTVRRRVRCKTIAALRLSRWYP